MTEGPIQHADLSASKADRWWHCPRSVALIRALPVKPPASIYAQRGTAGHLAAAGILTSGVEPDWPNVTFNGFVMEDDEIEAIKLYVWTIWEDQREFGGELLVEQKFDLSSLRPDMYGTCDAVLIKCRDHVLRVYDLKLGVGTVVEVENNLQEMYYGYGAVLSAKAGPVSDIELVIVQPRARHKDGPVRRWKVDLIDAHDWSIDLLSAAARTDDPDAPMAAGDWCQFCEMRPTCKVYAEYATVVAGNVFDEPPSPLPDPALLTIDEIAAILPKLPTFIAWANAIVGYAHNELERGRDVPGYKLVAKRGKRKWTQEDRDVIAALHGFGLTDRQIMEISLRSPAQVEKQLPKQERPLLKELYATVSSGTKIVPVDDPSPAVAGTGLDVFDVVSEGDAA